MNPSTAERSDGTDKPVFEQGMVDAFSDGTDKPTFEQDEVEGPAAAGQ